MTAPSSLLGLAHRGLTDAARTTAPGERYALAHLAALRAAAAVLACRTRPVAPTRRSRPRPVWALLADVAPELREWAGFFAAGAAKRAAAEAGLAGVVSPREADDLLRDAQSFVAVVETTLAARLAG
ncbi:MAG TPA: SAV_6107 family HEPN domain-containing protein [Mycobacteriales bacterium]|nr:SAV_6107 family HEPN domain-containing protein [Mycobacteriales bacterium]